MAVVWNLPGSFTLHTVIHTYLAMIIHQSKFNQMKAMFGWGNWGFGREMVGPNICKQSRIPNAWSNQPSEWIAWPCASESCDSSEKGRKQRIPTKYRKGAPNHQLLACVNVHGTVIIATPRKKWHNTPTKSPILIYTLSMISWWLMVVVYYVKIPAWKGQILAKMPATVSTYQTQPPTSYLYTVSI